MQTRQIMLIIALALLNGHSRVLAQATKPLTAEQNQRVTIDRHETNIRSLGDTVTAQGTKLDTLIGKVDRLIEDNDLKTDRKASQDELKRRQEEAAALARVQGQGGGNPLTQTGKEGWIVAGVLLAVLCIVMLFNNFNKRPPDAEALAAAVKKAVEEALSSKLQGTMQRVDQATQRLVETAANMPSIHAIESAIEGSAERGFGRIVQAVEMSDRRSAPAPDSKLTEGEIRRAVEDADRPIAQRVTDLQKAVDELKGLIGGQTQQAQQIDDQDKKWFTELLNGLGRRISRRFDRHEKDLNKGIKQGLKALTTLNPSP